MQNFLYEQIEHHVDKSAKASLLIMLDLYKRHVWTDTKTVNAISAGCLSKNVKMVTAACKFMLDVDLETRDLDDDESDHEEKKAEMRRVLPTILNLWIATSRQAA